MPEPRDPADAFVEGPAGRFWGTQGAAGLIAHDPARGVLLQLRASWSQHPDTWGLPGGALHIGEDAIPGALREASEEAGVPADALTIAAAHRRDEGYWSYTTVIADVTRPFEPSSDNHESTDVRWVPLDEVSALPLHPGLAAMWPALRDRAATPVLLVVDVANVMGSRPDGWWRDRPGAARRLIGQVDDQLPRGFPGTLLGAAPAWTLHPRTVAIVEGQATSILGRAGQATSAGAPTTQPDGRLPEGSSADAARFPRVEVVGAPADGDSAIVDLVAARPDADVTVVTSDRGLRSRLAVLGARCVGAGSLLTSLAD